LPFARPAAAQRDGMDAAQRVCPGQEIFEMSRPTWPKIAATAQHSSMTERRRLHAAALPSMEAAPSRSVRRSKRRSAMLARVLRFGQQPVRAADITVYSACCRWAASAAKVL